MNGKMSEKQRRDGTTTDNAPTVARRRTSAVAAAARVASVHQGKAAGVSTVVDESPGKKLKMASRHFLGTTNAPRSSSAAAMGPKLRREPARLRRGEVDASESVDSGEKLFANPAQNIPNADEVSDDDQSDSDSEGVDTAKRVRTNYTNCTECGDPLLPGQPKYHHLPCHYPCGAAHQAVVAQFSNPSGKAAIIAMKKTKRHKYNKVIKLMPTQKGENDAAQRIRPLRFRV